MTVTNQSPPMGMLGSAVLCAFAWLLVLPSVAGAQDASVVKRLRSYGQLSKRDAREVLRDVEARLSANADRGGEEYDAVRQAIGELLFPGKGPGRTMEIYRSRHAQVILELYKGLDERMLQGLFGPPGSAERCRQGLGMDARDCAALIAAARSQPLEQAVEDRQQPELRELLTNARSALQAGRLADAETAYAAITQLDPSHAMAFAGLGLSRAKAGKLDAAIQAYETAVSLAPNLVSLHVVLGRAYRLARRRAQARASFEHALALDPGHAEAQRELGEIGGRKAPMTPAQQLRAQAADDYRAGRYAQALAGYQRAADAEPGYAGTYAGIGACHLQLGDPDAAVRAYQMATQLNPSGAGLHAALGRALTMQGQNLSARAAFRSALSLDPNNKSARIGLAKLTAAGTSYAAKPSTRFPKYNGGWSPVGNPEAAPVQAAQVAAPPAAAPAAVAVPEPAQPSQADAPSEAEVAQESAPPVEAEPDVEAAEDSLMAGLLADPLGGSDAPPAAVAAGDPQALPQTPSRDQIATVMRELTPAIVQCVGKGYTGLIKLSFTVAGNTGEVLEGAPEGELSETDKGQCVSDALRAARFPLFSKDVLKIKYPVKL